METQGLGLRRQVQRARHRYAWWLALCAGVSANALLALALWVSTPPPRPPVIERMPESAVLIRDATPPPVVVVPAAAPVVVVVPAAAVEPPRVAFGDLGPCPAPHRAAPRGALAQPPIAHTLLGVATAPTDSRWVAAWSEEEVFTSRDGGRTWHGVLDGAGRVLDANFDCHGRVFVLRAGNGLGVRDGADERWQPLRGVMITPVEEDEAYAEEGDVRYEPRLVGGGRRIAVLGSDGPDVGEARAAISADAGATWWHVNLSWYEGADLHGAWNGDTLRVLVPWTDCMTEGVRMVTITPGGTRTEELDLYPGQLALDGMAVHAATHGCPDSDPVENGALCHYRDGKGWRQSEFAQPSADVAEAVLVDGAADVVLVGGTLHAVRNGTLARTGRAWPSTTAPTTVDAAGRAWGVVDGELIRR